MAYMKDSTGRRLDSFRAADRSVIPFGNRVVAIGDSIVTNNSGGWFKQLCQRSGQRALFGGYFALAGSKLAWARDTALPQVLALTGALKPAACVIESGANDVGGGDNGASFDFAASGATLSAITSALVAAGIAPILVKVTPHTAGQTSVLARTNGQRWNAYISMLAAANGWMVLDSNSPVVSLSGDYASGLSADGTHPNGTGFAAISAANVAAILAGFPGVGPFISKQAEPVNLIPTSAQLFNTAAVNGAAGGWNNYGGAGNTYTVETDAAIVGKWQTLTRPQAGSGNAYLQTNSATAVTTGFVPGDRLAFACLFQASGFSTQLDQQTAAVTVQFRNGSAVDLGGSLNPVYSSPSDFLTTAVGYDEGVVPAGTTQITIALQVGGAAATTGGSTLKVAQPTLINLTALGLA